MIRLARNTLREAMRVPILCRVGAETALRSGGSAGWPDVRREQGATRRHGADE